MRLLPARRQERIAVGLWIALALFIGNGIYDVLVARGTKEFLFRNALSEAGRGPAVALAPLMRTTVQHAAAVGALWAGLIIVVGLLTMSLARSAHDR